MKRSVLSQLDKPKYRDITASRVAALFDCHPFVTRAALAGALRSGGGPRALSSSAMRAGRLLEPAIAQAVGEKHPTWVIERARDYLRLPTHRLGAIPDYYINNRNAVMECKSVSPDEWRAWHGQPPLAYFIQLFTQMVCGGFSSGTLAVMVRVFDALPLHVFHLAAMDAAKSILLSAVRTWWEQIDAGVALPPPYPVDALRDLLQPQAAVGAFPPTEKPLVMLDGHRIVTAAAMTSARATAYGSKGWGTA
ncbi:MAG: hypothetical protein J0H44_13595 [Alphaproteobacteria bacterium]|nr:hypothetical protein [Alphaproteobacteria bacterium]